MRGDPVLGLKWSVEAWTNWPSPPSPACTKQGHSTYWDGRWHPAGFAYGGYGGHGEEEDGDGAGGSGVDGEVEGLALREELPRQLPPKLPLQEVRIKGLRRRLPQPLPLHHHQHQHQEAQAMKRRRDKPRPGPGSPPPASRL